MSRISLFGAVLLLLVVEADAQQRVITGQVELQEFLQNNRSGGSRFGMRYGGVGKESGQKETTSAILVWVESTTTYPETNAPKMLDQKDLKFDPKLVVLRKGGDVRIQNSDPVYHNVFSLSKVKSFDVGRRPKGEFLDVNFDQSGEVDVFCDIHSSMHATVKVLPNTASQWEIVGEGESFSIELKEKDIRVHVFAPGFKSKSIELTQEQQQDIGTIKLSQ